MRTFIRVADRGSLSAVAREFGTSQSTVTRHLGEMERALGAVLLTRTTRQVTLTDAGRRFYARCSPILQQVDQALDEVSHGAASATGTVRVSCTGAFGVLHASRLVFSFQDRHPGIIVELGLTDERVDLVREEVDLAIRIGPLTDSSMKLRRLGQSARLLVAAPGYLDRTGRPESPRDLSHHDSIRMSNVSGSDTYSLSGPGGERHAVFVKCRLLVDHGLAAREALLAGQGIAPAHRWLVDDLLTSGRLELVLPEYRPQSVPLSILVVPDRSSLVRVRLLMEHLVEGIRAVPGIEPPGVVDAVR